VETTATVSKRYGAGFTSHGTWEIVNTVGSTETYKLYTQDGSQSTSFSTHPIISGAPQFINFTVGPTPGSCSTAGSIAAGNFTIHSTVEFDVKFTSADDATKTGVYHYVVCANGGGTGYQGVSHVSPGYRQVYKNRYVPLAGQVFGNTNQMLDWTIVAAPSGGDATVTNPTYPQPVFYSGSVVGQYAIRGCPHVDHSAGACDELAIWVSPNNPPSGNTDKVEQVPCDVDTTMNPATVLDIGPSQTYSDLLAVPQSYTAPLLVRVHNEGADGTPTEYHNQLQLNYPTGGTWDDRHPAVLLCGVPNSHTGELPIVDGENATTNSWTSPYLVAPYGLISVTGLNQGPAINDGQVKPFHHVTIAGLHIRNVTTGYSYVDQSGGSGSWGASMGFRPFGIQYWSVIGTHAENVATPYFDDCNPQTSGWSACTLDTFYEGNHGEGYGTNGTSTEHMFYLQAFRDTSVLNLQDGGVAGDQGTMCFSDRGTRSFHMYNRCVSTGSYSSASGLSGHSEIQDAYNYVLPDEFWGYQGSSSCGTTYSTAPGCQGAFGGEDWFAALTEEHNNSDFVIGNYYYNTSGGSRYLGIPTTHNTTGIDNSSQGFYAFNTLLYSPNALPNGGSLWEDIRLGTQGSFSDTYIPVTWPRAQVQDNIIPWKDNTNCAYTCSTMTISGHSQMSFQTNLIAPGQVTVAPDIQPTGWLAGGIFHNGLNTSWSYYDPGGIAPINQFLGGFTSGNFIPYNVFPVNTTTGVTLPGSNAVGAASSLTGQLAYYPPRFNPVTANMDPFTLRVDLSTIGATDPGNSATLSSIALTPNPASVGVSGTVQLTAICTYVDSSTADCTNAATWSTASSSFHMDGVTPGLVHGDAVGTGTATAAIGSIVGQTTVNVSSGGLVAATPTFSPTGGTYSSAQTITISTTTPSATIYYTTDGSTPTTGSTVYTAPITVTATETLKAIASAPGYSTSGVGSAAYTIAGGPSFVQECHDAEFNNSSTCTLTGVGAGHTLAIGVLSGAPLISVTSSSGTVTSAVNYGTSLSAYIVPNTTAGNITITANAAGGASFWLSVSEYANTAVSPMDGSGSGGIAGYGTAPSSNFTTTGTSDLLWAFCSAPGGVTITPGTAPITWTGRPTPTASGAATLVEDGIAVTPGTYYGQCTDGSSIVSLALKAGNATATPTFSPTGGTYSSSQTVTISTTTPSATIYYTTNGSAPTTDSTVYSAPITVAATETIKAIATAPGYSASGVGSAAYTIAGGPSFVQECHDAEFNTSSTCTLTGVGAGHTLVIGVHNTAPLTSVTSSSGTVTNVVSEGTGLNAYIVPNTTAGNVTITASSSSGASFWLSVNEYANTAVSPLDGSGSGSIAGYGTAPSANFTTTGNSDLLWAFCVAPGGATITPGTAPITWTGRPTPTASGAATLVEDGIAVTPGTYYGQCTDGSNIVSLALKQP